MYKKLFFRMVELLFCSVLVGFFLLVLVYMIPTQRIVGNIRNSIEQYDHSISNPHWATGYEYTMIDDYTDTSFILPNAIYPSAQVDDFNPIMNAALTPHNDYISVNNDIIYAVSDSDINSFKFNYVRYWHGYLIFLKPLLYIFSLNSVRIMNFFFEIILTMFFIQVLMIKTKDLKLGFAFTVALVILNPVSTALGFQLAAVYNVMIMALVVLLFIYDKMDPLSFMPLFFLLIGIVVVYVDFLTYPVVSLVIPLLMYLWLCKDVVLKETKKGIFFVCLYSLSWGIGYVGMWVSKWIIATIISGGEENALLECYRQIIYRSGNGEVYFSFLEVVVQNIRALANWPFLMFFVFIIVLYLLSWILIKKGIVIKEIIKINVIVPIILAGLIPFVWYLGTREHSMDHFNFTYRNLSGIVMSVLLVVPTVDMDSIRM